MIGWGIEDDDLLLAYKLSRICPIQAEHVYPPDPINQSINQSSYLPSPITRHPSPITSPMNVGTPLFLPGASNASPTRCGNHLSCLPTIFLGNSELLLRAVTECTVPILIVDNVGQAYRGQLGVPLYFWPSVFKILSPKLPSRLSTYHSISTPIKQKSPPNTGIIISATLCGTKEYPSKTCPMRKHENSYDLHIRVSLCTQCTRYAL